MDVSLRSLLMLARETVAAPREGARRVLALDLSLGEGLLALALMAVVSGLMMQFAMIASPPGPGDYLANLLSQPFRAVILQGALWVLGAWAMYWVGAMRGGQGTLPGAVVLVAWLQFILTILQVVQMAALVLLPPLAGVLGMAGVALFFWLLTHFVMELHGFRSAIATLAGAVGTLILVGMVLAAVLAPFLDLSEIPRNV